MAKTAAKCGINTRLAHSGNDPHDYFGFVNPPVVHASTVLFPDARDDGGAQPEIHLRHARHADHRRACRRRSTRWKARPARSLVPSGLAAVTVPLLAFLSAGDHLLIVDSVYHPTRNFADTMLKRLGVEVEYYDPHDRRRHRGADQAQHQGRVHRIAGLQHVRGAGHPGDRQGGARRAAPSS